MNRYYRKKLFCLILFSLPLALISCVNLKTVSDFSATSMESIEKFELIDYTFLQHCLDRCEDEAIRNYEIKRAKECSCDVYQQADSVTQVVYNSIAGYFEGLENLSHNELTVYRSEELVGALSMEELGPLKIDERTVNAFSSLSNTLLRSSSDFYRRKKLTSYIEQANEPIQVLIEKFGVIIGANLKGELRFKRERLYAYYMDMKMNRTLVSDYEKGEAATNYYKALGEIQRKEMELEVFAKGMEEIAKGHQVLYDNRENLSVKNLQNLMLRYSNNVMSLISEFNKLNN